ncbi:hypothetical protein GUJ93_ZPchr0010g10851 [Zizania palustris]|uniref:Uncharacterized protein n=1 Tax=Zizania palustris TaxID=103762 RepID=A0A8J5WCP9_ZIZPA|nr:hypothetical protein GUJ93_ZPchr0010g10851 [Zizania palustris]
MKEEAPIMVVEVSGSDDEAHPAEGSEGASRRSKGSSYSTSRSPSDIRWVLMKLPSLAMFLTPGSNLRPMVEPLAQVYRDLGQTYLVAEVSCSNRIELVRCLSSGAMDSFDKECSQLMTESMGLHDLLADSREKVSNLEDMLQKEQKRRVAF